MMLWLFLLFFAAKHQPPVIYLPQESWIQGGQRRREQWRGWL